MDRSQQYRNGHVETPLLRFSLIPASKTRALRTCACANRGGVAATDHVSLRTTQPPPPCPANASRLDGATYKASYKPHRSFTSHTTLVKIYRQQCDCKLHYICITYVYVLYPTLKITHRQYICLYLLLWF